MAILENNTAAPAAGQVRNNKDRRAKAWVNINIPALDGKSKKVGAFPLEEGNAVHEKLLECYEASADKEAAVRYIISKLVFNINVVTDDADLDLGLEPQGVPSPAGVAQLDLG